jgi:hypothetical protein
MKKRKSYSAEFKANKTVAENSALQTFPKMI